MKVISLLQPWATLVVIGAKQIETRSWNTKFRGDILIHASAKFDRAQQMLCRQDPFSKFIQDCSDLPRGAIIGRATLIYTDTTDLYLTLFGVREKLGWVKRLIVENEKAFGDYTPGRYGWLMQRPVPFQKPIPAKGSLGLWECPETILNQINAL